MSELDDAEGGTRGVTAVTRAIEILRALGESDHDLTLAQIAEVSGVPRSTVHRLIQTLQRANFVSSSGRSGGLGLGPEFVRLASLSPVQLVRIIHPYLEHLSNTLSEGSSLAVLEGDKVRFLDQHVSGQGLRAVSLVGSTFPAHCTANGKALLAALPQSLLVATLPKRLERLTPQTIVDRSALLEELDRVREAGIAYDREEHAEGICAVGAAVHDPTGRRAAITVALPAQRFYGREDQLTEALLDVTRRVDLALARIDDSTA